MPSGPRIRANNVLGLTTNAPLTIGAVTFGSAGLVYLPVVAAAHATVTLDPLREFGEPEIVVVTAHTASAAVATIVRGQYGTVARSHPVNTTWVHAPLDEDFNENVATTAEIPDPYRGQMLFDRTLNRYVGRETTDVWSNVNMLADPPACRVYNNAAQSIPDAGELTVLFNTERYDTGSMHSTSSLTSRITINKAGLYLFTFVCNIQAGTDYTDVYAGFLFNASLFIGIQRYTPASGVGPGLPSFAIATTYKMAVADYMEIKVSQNNAANVARNLESNPAYSPEFSATWIGRG